VVVTLITALQLASELRANLAANCAEKSRWDVASF